MQYQFNGTKRYSMAEVKSKALLKSVLLSGASRVLHVREITGSRFLTVQNKLVYRVFAPKTPLKHIPKRTFGPTRRKSNMGWARSKLGIILQSGVWVVARGNISHTSHAITGFALHSQLDYKVIVRSDKSKRLQ